MPTAAAGYPPGSKQTTLASVLEITPWYRDSQFYIPLLGVLGFGGIIAYGVRRYYERKDKREDAAPALRFHLQRLEKRITIVFHYPGSDSGAENYFALAKEFREAMLACAGLFTKKQRIPIEQAVGTCEIECQYLMAQRDKALTNDAEMEIRASARRALFAIYDAREALCDNSPLLWPPDVENRGLWDSGSQITRII